MRILTLADREEWRSSVAHFGDRDVYYLPEYAESLMLHGDGEPRLIVEDRPGRLMCWAVMERDIADARQFRGMLPRGRYFDWETPYGYGGPLAEGEWTRGEREGLSDELREYCRSRGVVSQFVRFHPMIQNQADFEGLGETRYLRDTIFIDTSDEERIARNMDGKNRNMVRKAERLGVAVSCAPDSIDAFLEAYRDTMDLRDADEYYYFDEEYFSFMAERLPGNIVFFNAALQGKIVSSALFLYNDDFMHYHLAGTLREHRNLAASNLILYKASLWACGKGIKALHLGGGIRAGDSLYGFKKQFNTSGQVKFFVGRSIFDADAYDFLLGLRKDGDPGFAVDDSYMIGYRK
jgi:hypothetical protein